MLKLLPYESHTPLPTILDRGKWEKLPYFYQSYVCLDQKQILNMFPYFKSHFNPHRGASLWYLSNFIFVQHYNMLHQKCRIVALSWYLYFNCRFVQHQWAGSRIIPIPAMLPRIFWSQLQDEMSLSYFMYMRSDSWLYLMWWRRELSFTISRLPRLSRYNSLKQNISSLVELVKLKKAKIFPLQIFLRSFLLKSIA